MCIVCIANNINRNVYMDLNTRIFPTSGYARVLLFMFIRRELGGMVQDVYFSLHTVIWISDMFPGIELPILSMLSNTGGQMRSVHEVCFARASIHVADFNTRNKFLTQKLLR